LDSYYSQSDVGSENQELDYQQQEILKLKQQIKIDATLK